jgi:hypothetical protein
VSKPTSKKRKIQFKPIPKLQNITNRIVDSLGESVKIDVRHTLSRGPYYTCYTSKKYSKNKDWVCIPEPERFVKSKYYYKTLLHELAHAACSRTRLCLKFSGEQEEIAVEASALTICFLSGYNLWTSCLGYMTNWSYDKKDRLSIARKCQWDSMRNKTKKIVKHLLHGN